MISWIASTIFGVHYSLRNFRICQTVLRRRLRFVKPYVKTNKNDMAAAEAICEAVTRPNMRFVSIKTPEQ
ncbi:hypothetical protein ACXYST_21235, partial [Escherichia coli]